MSCKAVLGTLSVPRYTQLGTLLGTLSLGLTKAWLGRNLSHMGTHLVGAAEGCGPQVRELALLGAGNHVFHPLLAHSRSSPTWRLQKGLALGVKVQETGVQFLGQEDPLEKGRATHSSILAWRMPWTEKPGGLLSMGSQRVRHD